jgi:hypothetical protein
VHRDTHRVDEEVAAAIQRAVGNAAVIVFDAEKETISFHHSDPNGFDVKLYSESDRITVDFDGWYAHGWHAHFKSIEEAVNCFLWGLTPFCTVVEESVGGQPVKWTAYSWVSGEWKWCSAVVYPGVTPRMTSITQLRAPLNEAVLRPGVRVLQNRVLMTEDVPPD